MQDGSRYRGKGTLKHGRVIEVDRVDHQRAINKQSHIQPMADFAGALTTTEGRWCDNCKRAVWKWNTTCPKCGGDTKEGIE